MGSLRDENFAGMAACLSSSDMATMRPYLRAPPMDAFLASNWNRGYGPSHTWSRGYGPSLWDKDAMGAWQTRLKKEKQCLGLENKVDFGRSSCGRAKVNEIRIPTLHGWKSVPTLPVVTKADDFVPAARGPFERRRPRLGTTSNDYGTFHRVAQSSPDSCKEGLALRPSTSVIPSGAPLESMENLEAFLRDKAPRKPARSTHGRILRTDPFNRTR